MRRWEHMPFLILDDFAAVPPKSYGADLLQALAAARFNEALPTL